ncbi:MAG: UDP-N-acetylmuramoyl-L-alanine--D-glutamate ligase [Bacteroidales bacterium]|nr:UDP-N-acetylmuramoyl-L-alanine--D-glutamate ligase [Bacteroidales bacterium]
MIRTITEILGGKKILILGFGREGKETLAEISKCISADMIDIADRLEEAVPADISASHTTFTGSEEYEKCLLRINDYDMIIKSPGIPESIVDGIPESKITSQTDLFLRRYHKQVVGITGTKGKSTTTSLTYHILKESGKDAVIVGNIGIPAFSAINKISDSTIIVMELSAHQLNHITISPHIALLLNIYEEHLDQFITFANYYNAKCNIFLKQNKEDILIVDMDIMGIGQALRGYCGRIIDLNNAALYDISGSRLMGRHNAIDANAAGQISRLLCVSDSEIESGIASFTPLPHRLEYVGTFSGIKFYNDSIATIPEAVIAAIETVKDVDTIILGGYDRGIGYNKLCRFLSKSKISNILLLGGAGDRIGSIIKERYSDISGRVVYVKNMHEAVEEAFRCTRTGNSCLLSPAASSYDMFKNFEERGNYYKSLINAHK